MGRDAGALIAYHIPAREGHGSVNRDSMSQGRTRYTYSHRCHMAAYEAQVWALDNTPVKNSESRGGSEKGSGDRQHITLRAEPKTYPVSRYGLAFSGELLSTLRRCWCLFLLPGRNHALPET
jgi:hypothetical protein